MKKDVDNLSSSRSLARLTRNSRNTPPASGNHPKSRNNRPITRHFGPNPVALGRGPLRRIELALSGTLVARLRERLQGQVPWEVVKVLAACSRRVQRVDV
jgi:hypothetical protein